MTKFAKALKKFVKELQKKHPHVPRTLSIDVKSVPIDSFLNACNNDIDGFITKSMPTIIMQNPFSHKNLEMSILLSEDVPETVKSMVWTYLQSMYVYAFYDTHPKSEVEIFLQKYGKHDPPSYVTKEWANVAKVYQSVYGRKDAALLTTSLPLENSSLHGIASDIARESNAGPSNAAPLNTGQPNVGPSNAAPLNTGQPNVGQSNAGPSNARSST